MRNNDSKQKLTESNSVPLSMDDDHNNNSFLCSWYTPNHWHFLRSDIQSLFQFYIGN